MYQLRILFWRVSVQDSKSLFSDIGATHADLMEAAVFCLCVKLHPQPMIDND